MNLLTARAKKQKIKYFLAVWQCEPIQSPWEFRTGTFLFARHYAVRNREVLQDFKMTMIGYCGDITKQKLRHNHNVVSCSIDFSCLI